MNDAKYETLGTLWFRPDHPAQGVCKFSGCVEVGSGQFRKPKKIFVSGSSAGSYGAIMGFPYIKESFPKSKVYVLGDAGNGVTTEAFQG